MEYFTWQKEYGTGIALIDQQHKDLFKHFDKLAIALYKGKGKTELQELIGFLRNYIRAHFEKEENLMLYNDYPDRSKHIAQHKDFIDFFNKLEREFLIKGSDSYLAIEAEKKNSHLVAQAHSRD